MNQQGEHAMAERFHAAFQDIQRRLRKQLQCQLAADTVHNLTRGQFFLLRHLQRHTSCTISELAQWMNVTAATMSTIVGRLEKNKLVVRTKDDKDRRTVFVGLTEAGLSIVVEIEQGWQTMLAEELSGLSQSEQVQLVTLLERLNNRSKQAAP